MIGAIAGDIIGSVYERRPIKTNPKWGHHILMAVARAHGGHPPSHMVEANGMALPVGPPLGGTRLDCPCCGCECGIDQETDDCSCGAQVFLRPSEAAARELAEGNPSAHVVKAKNSNAWVVVVCSQESGEKTAKGC